MVSDLPISAMLSIEYVTKLLILDTQLNLEKT